MTDFRITPRGVLAGYSGAGGHVIVPDTVRVVGPSAFRGMPAVLRVALPASVTAIGEEAFAGCSGLVQVVGPTSLEFVAENAFANTPATILAPPMRLTLQGTVLSWLAPTAGAYSYSVFVNDQEVATTEGTSLDMARHLVAGVTNTIEVCAVGYYGQESLRSAVLDFAQTPQAVWRQEAGGLPSGAQSLTMSANGSCVIAGYEAAVRILEDGAALVTLPDGANAVAISADGQMGITISPSATFLIEKVDGRWGSFGTLRPGLLGAISADGRTIAVVGFAEDIILYRKGVEGAWVLHQGPYAPSAPESEGFGCAIALSADGTVLAVGAKDAQGGVGAVHIYSGTDWSQRTTLTGESGYDELFGRRLALSADGTRLLIASAATGTLWIKNGGSWTLRKTFYGQTSGSHLAMSADGTTLVISDATGKARVLAENQGVWPEVATFTGCAGPIAISSTGDRVAFASGVEATFRRPGESQGPSMTTRLAMTRVRDATTAAAAAQYLVKDIQACGGVGSHFIRGLVAEAPEALATLLIASNLLPDQQNDAKVALFEECVTTLGFPRDTYVPVDQAYIQSVILSVPAEYRDPSYYPSSLYAFFPTGSTVVPDPTYTNTIYCLAPGVEYAFGPTAVNYKRTSEIAQTLVSLPGGASFVPPAGGVFSASATVWRRVNKYGGRALLEAAMSVLEMDPAAIDYVWVSWLATDMLLSADADLERLGRILIQKYLPYARGVAVITAFGDSQSDTLASGTFVGAADGSVAFPERLVLWRSTPLTRIEPLAFDAGITEVVLNGVSYTAAGGNLTRPAAETGVWMITVNGTEILLPEAPIYGASSVTLPRTLALIPSNYFAVSGLTTVNFALAQGEEQQVIEEGAFPAGCQIIVDGNTGSSYTYTGTEGRLVRLGGVFYMNYDTVPSVVWYPSPLRILGSRLAVPSWNVPLEIACETAVTFVITGNTDPWSHVTMNTQSLIQNTTLAHAIEYRVGTTALRYANFPGSTGGISYSVASVQTYPLVKLMLGYHLAHANRANEGLMSLLGAIGTDPATTVIIPRAGTTVAEAMDAPYKLARYRFTRNSLAEGQRFYHGNLGWTNSRSVTGSRIVDAQLSEGTVYFQAGAFSLYPHMFAPWRKSLVSVRETDGYELVSPDGTVPAYAFKDCVRLQNHEIVFDRSVGDSAFENCTALQSLGPAGKFLRGQGVPVRVGVRAFKGCVGLTDVEIAPQGHSLEIAEAAFEGCTGLTQVVLDASGGTLRVGKNAFRNCSAVGQISLRAGGEMILDAGAFAGCTEATSLRLESAGLTIRAGVFNGLPKLRDITIVGHGTITIAERAFTGCCTVGGAGSLTVQGAAGKIMVNTHAFSGCTNLSSISVASTGEVMFGDYAFRDCAAGTVPVTSGLTVSTSGTVTIAKGTFQGCTHLGPVLVTTSGMVFVFGDAFNGCYQTTRPYGARVVLRGSRTAVDTTAFAGCSKITSITVTGLTTSNSFPFTQMTGLTDLSGTTANPLMLGTMAGCTALQTATLSGVDLAIDSDQFTGCTALQAVSIRNPLTGMVATALSGCTALQTVALHFRDDAACVLGTMSTSPQLRSLRITGGSVLTLPTGFCNLRTALQTVALQSQVLRVTGTTALSNVFNGCTALSSLSLETTDMVSTSADIEINTVLTGLRTLDISGNLKTSGATQFWNNGALESIRIRGRLMSDLVGIPISTIRVVDIRAQNPITISAYTYMNAPVLEVFKVNDILTIDEGAFFGCTRLSTFEFGEKLESINNWAFMNSGISGEVVLPDSLDGNIGVGYFVGCPNLKRVTYSGSVIDFEDPTRFHTELWNRYVYDTDDTYPYDISGTVVITKGTDDAYQVQYAEITNGVVGTTQTIPKSTLYKDMNWTRLRERIGYLDAVIETLMGYCRNHTTEDSVPDWIVSPIWQLKAIAQDCESIWDKVPSLSTFGGWNPVTRRFTTIDNAAQGIDASGNTIDPSGHHFISGGDYTIYELQVYDSGAGNVSANFEAAIAANNALFQPSAGASYLSVPVPYTMDIAPKKLRLLLPQDKIQEIEGDMVVKRSGNDILCEWKDPVITMDDNTIFTVKGIVTRPLTMGMPANRYSTVQWIVDNYETAFGMNNIGISLRGLSSSIKNISNKKNTTIEIYSATVLINLYAMTSLLHTTVKLFCAVATIENSAFSFWSGGSTLYMRGIYPPNVGVEVFSGSKNITIDSNQFLINSPIVQLADISSKKLDDVPNIILTETGIDPAKTRNVKIGTFIPQEANGFDAYTYIEFQELPTLKMYYLVQKPDDWFWTCHYSDENVEYMRYLKDFTTSGAGNQNPGLVDRMAPASFKFAGYEFTRTDDKWEDFSTTTRRDTVFRALKTTDDAACKDMYENTKNGKIQGILIDVGIDLGVALIIGLLTFGFGVWINLGIKAITLTLRIIRVIVTITLEIIGVIIVKIITIYRKTGTVTLGEFSYTFFFEILLIVIFHVRFPKPKPTDIITPDKITKRKLQRGVGFRGKAPGGPVPVPPPEQITKEVLEEVVAKEGDAAMDILKVVPGTDRAVGKFVKPLTRSERAALARVPGSKKSTNVVRNSSEMRNAKNLRNGTKPDGTNNLPEPRPKTPDEIADQFLALKNANPNEFNRLSNSTLTLVKRFATKDTIIYSKGAPLYKRALQKLGECFAEDVQRLGPEISQELRSAFLKTLEDAATLARDAGVTSRSLDRDGGSIYTYFQQLNLNMIFATMLLLNDSTSAASAYAIAQVAKEYDNEIGPAAADVTLGDLSCYNSQALIPTLGVVEARDDAVFYTESYYDAYDAATSVAIPPFMYPVGRDPIHPKTTYLFSEFIGNGTNYKHPYRQRVQNGRQCQVVGIANRLLLRPNYMWDNTFLGGPSNITNYEVNNLTIGVLEKFDVIIMTINESINSELYLANRPAMYGAGSRREAQNLVYSGAQNISVIVPTEVTEIPNNAFNCADNTVYEFEPFTLQAVHTHVDLIRIGDYAFSRSGLQQITYPTGVLTGTDTFLETRPRYGTFGTGGIRKFEEGGGLYTFRMSSVGSGSISKSKMTFNYTNNFTVERGGILLTDTVIPTPASFTETIVPGQLTTTLIPTAATTMTFQAGGNTIVLNLADIAGVCFVQEIKRVITFSSSVVLVERQYRIEVTTDIVRTTSVDASGNTRPMNIYKGTNLSDFTVYPNVVKQNVFVFTGAGNVVINNLSSISIHGYGTTRAIREVTETSVDDCSFYNSDLIARPFIPTGCVRIGESAYEGCSGMRETVCLPAGLRSLGAKAFARTNICGIVIPPTVTEIGAGAIPAQAKVILEADETGAVTPAIESLFATLGKTNCVIVRTFDMLHQILPMAGSVPIRLERPPPPPTVVKTEVDRTAAFVSWEMAILARDTPATSYTVRWWHDGEADASEQKVEAAPFCIRGLEDAGTYHVSVTAMNGAGESAPNTVMITV